MGKGRGYGVGRYGVGQALAFGIDRKVGRRSPSRGGLGCVDGFWVGAVSDVSCEERAEDCTHSW